MKIVNLLMLGALLPFAPAFAGEHPCKELHQQLVKACEAQGFTKGGHAKGKNKGIWVDCLEVIKKGGTVEGVVPDAELTKACNAKKQKHHGEKKSEKDEG